MIKKVLFVCSVYKPNIGGIETTIEELCKNLNEKDIETNLLTKLFPFELPTIEKFGNTEVLRMKRSQNDDEYLESIHFLKSNEKRIKADVVHIIGVRRPMPLYALLLSRYWEVPCVVTFAGGDIPDYDDPESIEIWKEGLGIVPEAIKQADLFTSFSQYTANLARKNISGLKDIKIIYAGIDLDKNNKIKPHKEKFSYFFTARRLDLSKGIDLLIKAYGFTKSQINGTKLIIAGDGIEREKLQELVKQLGLQNDVLFLSGIDNFTVISYMKGAIAHICPSRTEGGGIVNYEAQVSGCIAIGSDVGGIPEYIEDGITGFLFPSENIEALAKLLLRVYKDKNLRKEIISMANKEMQTKTWGEFSKQYLDLYNSLVQHYRHKDFEPWSKLTQDMWRGLSNE